MCHCKNYGIDDIRNKRQIIFVVYLFSTFINI